MELGKELGDQDSQGVQTLVSKRLSKTICAAPRVRFQRAKPKVPSIKRPDSGFSQPKTLTSPVNESTKSNSQSSVERRKAPIEDSSPEPSGSQVSDGESLSSVAVESDNCSTQSSQSTELLENLPKSGSTEIGKETSNQQDENCDLLKNACSVEKDEVFEKGNSENFQSQNASPVEKVEVLHKESSENSQQLKRSVNENLTEVISSVPSISDKASRYPQLTSLLSKKRPEPKKDVPPKRKRFKKGDAIPERNKMTMADLIYWNPTSKDLGMKKISDQVTESTETAVEEPAENAEEPETQDVEEDVSDEDSKLNTAPRLMLAEDGTILIDQKSLVVKRKTAPPPPANEVQTNEETTYASFRKRPMSKQWSFKETYIFYKALTLVGTDFGLMENMMPSRTRRELKLKFKREEKCNPDLIEKALYLPCLTFDAKALQQEIENLNSVGIDSDMEDNLSQANGKTKKRKRQSSGKKAGTENELRTPEAEPFEREGLANSEDVPVVKEMKKKGRTPKKVKVLPDTFTSAKSAEKKKRKPMPASSEDESIQDFVDLIEGTSQGCEMKRRRKKKVLSECFIDPDEVESIDDNGSCLSQDFSRPNSPSESVSYESQFVVEECDESTNIELLLVQGPGAEIPTTVNESRITALRGETSVNDVPIVQEIVQDSDKNSSIAFKKPRTKAKLGPKEIRTSRGCKKEATSKAVKNRRSKPLEQLISLVDKTIVVQNVSTDEISGPVEVIYEEPIQQGSVEETIVGNVMANEEVMSDLPKIGKKKANLSKAYVLPGKQPHIVSDGGPSPSFLKYTPVELESDSEVHFDSSGNSKTYSNSPMRTPKNTNKLITSIQALQMTPEQSSSLSTSLNRTSSLNFTIPISPELESKDTTNPVMLLAQAPNEENVFHFFMYKEKESHE